MSTVIRAETSKKGKYWIPKERYYELKHFCLQYPRWIAEKAKVSLLYSPISQTGRVLNGMVKSPTEETALRLAEYDYYICLIEKAAKEAGGDLSSYLLIAVTNGVSYPVLAGKYGIPCCRDSFYAMYRRFFYILDGTRK